MLRPQYATLVLFFILYGFCPPTYLEVSGTSQNENSERIRFFKQDTGIYILRALEYEVPEFNEEEGTLVSLGCLDELRPSLQDAIRATSSPLDRIDAFQLRNRFGLSYIETQDIRHPDFVLPNDVNDFIRLTDFKSWPIEVIPVSRVKGKTRALYHNPPDFPFKISIAVTHDSLVGDINSAVRETEIIIKQQTENSKDWDFYAYDHNGQLQPHSEFRRGLAPSPAACMSCHYSAEDRSFVPLQRPLEIKD